MRINKFLAHCGIASRRNSEKLILDGKILVNGKVMTDLSYKVDIKNDIVTYNNKSIKPISKKFYFALNKPVGYLSSNKSKFHEKLIFDLIQLDTKLFSIGRLDKDSRGLILITNDGEIYNKVIHPRSEILKTYIVELDKKFILKHKKLIENGVDIGNYITNKSYIEIIGNKKLKIQINEGKNRQVRKMFAAFGYEVIDLNRVSIGEIYLKNLPIGKYRELSEEELKYLNDL